MLSIDKISSKSTNAVIYSIKYIKMKSLDYVIIDSENYLYLIFNNVDWYFGKESNGDKYVVLASTDKNKEVLTK